MRLIFHIVITDTQVSNIRKDFAKRLSAKIFKNSFA